MPTNNQTEDLTPILPNSELDFNIEIQSNPLQLSDGLHSFCIGVIKSKWLLICGRSNGMHGFSNTDPNFPVNNQNLRVYVVDIKHQTIKYRNLTSSHSGLSQSQVDYLSVVSPQFCQQDQTLYITGGYGVNSQTTEFGTKPILSIINLPKLIDWVEHPHSKHKASSAIEFVEDLMFQITGGAMAIIKDKFLLVFGQTFTGQYRDMDSPDFSQVYSDQVRRFELKSHHGKTEIKHKKYYPHDKDENYRRRDLNILPRITTHHYKSQTSLVAYSGVFTPETGYWTVPVEISSRGHPTMADPTLDSTFKQGMNIYACATAVMYSIKHLKMYSTFFGGITYEYYQSGSFVSDAEFPFTNQCTTIQINDMGQYSQYLMDNQYPVILSTSSNPGNQLLFGAGAQFVIKDGLKTINNQGLVIDYDHLSHGRVKIGYIIGGIQSTVPNTNTITDSSASPLIFDIYINKH